MRYWLVTLLLISFVAQAQPPGYVQGTQVPYTLPSGRFVGWFQTEGWSSSDTNSHVYIFFGGDGQTNTTNYDGMAPSILVKQGGSGSNWDAKVVMSNGDTTRWAIITIPTVGNQPSLYATDIAYVINELGVDTAQHKRFHIGGGSGGPGRAGSYLRTSGSPYTRIFSTGIWMSTTIVTTTDWPVIYNYTWYGTADANGGTPPSFTINMYNNLPGTPNVEKFLDSTIGGTHSNSTWSDCHKFTTNSNRWHWMVEIARGGGGGPVIGPTANAGGTYTITLPATLVNLVGSGSTGTIVTYAWTKIAGGSATITSPSSANTSVTGLSQGVYTFRLTVTDNNGLTDQDDATVQVNQALGSIVIGQQRKRLFGGREFMYFIPDTVQRPNLKYYFVLNGIDSTGKDSAYAETVGLCKKIKNGWDGIQPLTNGDTALFTVLTYYQGIDIKDSIEHYIQWAVDSLPNQCFDTATRDRNIMTSIGLGAQRQLYYLLNKFGDIFQGGTLKFNNNFAQSTLVDLFVTTNLAATNGWLNQRQPFKSWWWVGGGNTGNYNPTYTSACEDSANNYNSYPQVKLTNIGGQNYSTLTHDSVYSTIGTGGIDNIARWWANDAEFGFPGSKILINEWQVEGMSGQNGQASKNCWFLFDSPWDIKQDTGMNSPADTTDPQVVDRFIVYRRNNCIGVWVNYQEMKDFYAGFGHRKNASTSYPDTMDIYFGGWKINTREFFTSNWRTRTDYDVRLISIGNSTSWDKIFEKKFTAQYVFVVIRRNTYSSPFPQSTDGNYRDFVFYGNTTTSMDSVTQTIYNLASEEQLNTWDTVKPTIQDHSGVTLSNIYYRPTYGYNHLGRGFNLQIFNGTGRYPFNVIDYPTTGPTDTTNFINFDSSIIHDDPGKVLWIAPVGASSYVVDSQSKRIYAPDNPLYGSTNQKRTDSIGIDAGVPANYKTYSNNLTGITQAFSSNTTRTSKVRYTNGATRMGRNIYKRIELGNEDDGGIFDSTYLMPYEAGAMWWACYDGDKGAMNIGLDTPAFGVKYADPTVKVGNGAFIGFNYRWLTAGIIASKIYNQSDSIPLDILMGHVYFAYYPNKPGNQTLIGQHTTFPELNGYFQELIKVNRSLRRVANKDPNRIKTEINEYGGDKTDSFPQCVSGCDRNVFNWSSYGMSANDIGLDSAQMHAINLTASMFAIMFAGFNTSCYFTFSDDHKPYEGLPIFPYAGSATKYTYRNNINFNVDSIHYYAGYWFFDRDVLKRLAPFRKDVLIDSITKGRYVYRLDRPGTDTLLYVIRRADTIGVNVTYNVPVPTGASIVEYSPSFTESPATYTPRTATGGFYTASVGIVPKFYFVIGSNVRNYFRGSLRNGKFINVP